ncbi:MAG: flagellin [Lachnospiraceae bacterium]|nr:flagellin [Lachnospiraceae bacterium]
MSVLSSMLIADEFAKMDLEIKAEPDDEMRRAGELLMLSHDNMCRLCSVMVDPNAIVTQPNGVYDPDEKTDDYINQKIVFNKLYSDVFATDSETLKLTATLMTTSVEFKWADHRDAKGNRIQNLERAIFEAGDYSPYYNMNEAPLDWLKGQGALVCDILKNNGRISDGKYTGTGDYGASEFARLAVNYMSKAEPSLTSGRLRDLYRELIGGGSQTSRERTAVAIYKYMYGLEEGGDGFNRTRIQSGADCGDEIFIDIRPMDASILGIAGLDVSTENGATGAIDTAGEALKKLSAMRSLIGAQQNRLEHTIANQKNIIENTQHSESVIRDTDMAEEMVRFSKENILQQAGQSMLAQANRSTEGVLALLR